METVAIPRKLESEEVNYVLNLKPEDITASFLRNTFTTKLDSKGKDIPPKFIPSDYFTLEANKFYNPERITTTVGRFIYNLFVMKDLHEVMPYINYQMSDKGLNKTEDRLCQLLIENKINTDQMKDYLDRTQWLSFTLSGMMNSSLTLDILVPTKEIKEKKKELIKKYSKAIEEKDIVGINKMEKEMLAYAEEIVKNIPDFQIYASGGRGSFSNNYKNTVLMRGIIKNLGYEDEINLSLSSLEEGIGEEELYKYGDLITQASYSRAVGTRQGGLISKIFRLTINSFNCWNTLVLNF